MITLLVHLYNGLQALSKGNPVFAGVISLYGLGMLTFAFRDVPVTLWNLITHQLTTSMTLNSHDDIFYTFLTWVSKHKMHSFMRTYNLGGANRWGVREEILSIGYGKTFLIFKGLPIFISRYKVEANATEYAKETIQLTILGRNSKRFYELLDEMKDSLKNAGDTFTVYAWRDHWWFQMAALPKRSLNTLSLPQKTRAALVRHIRAFISEKAWFLASGIPYRTGILLQGPPGTGKTSLITAICSDFNKGCYVLDLAGHTDITLKEAVSKIPHGDILVIEDIDTHFGKRGDLDKPLTKDDDKDKDDSKDLANPWRYSKCVRRHSLWYGQNCYRNDQPSGEIGRRTTPRRPL
jgi:chaperone BCS1